MTERPAINRMLDDIKAGHVQNVLVFKLDRLTRSVADLVQLIDLFKTHDCAFNSLTESIDTSTASGRMFLKIIGIFAEFERENIGERVRLGMERKAREGYSIACGNTSFGYDKDNTDKIQKINPAEAETVRRVFDMYTRQNMTLNGIAKQLNAEKVPTKLNSFWNSGTIYMLLTNPVHIGIVRYGIEQPERYFEVDGKHESIISKELFYETQDLLQANKRATYTKRGIEKNYFLGVVFCGVCGTRMKTHIAKNTQSFVCPARVVGACICKNVTAAKVENAVIDYINNIPYVAPDFEKDEQEKEAAAARVIELQNKIAVLDAKDKAFLDSYIADNFSLEEYRDVKKMIGNERKELQAEIDRLTPKDKSKSHVEPKTKEEIIRYFKRNWHNFNNIEKRQFLLKHIGKVKVINHPVKGSIFGNCEITDIEFNTN
jgi:site-specific DNA recombinase